MLKKLKISNIIEETAACRKMWTDHADRMGEYRWLKKAWKYKIKGRIVEGG
jgi:hypothetical protein